MPVVRNDAHRIIEECMLAANVCASAFLEEHKQTCLYRVHAAPSEDKLQNLRAFLGEFGWRSAAATIREPRTMRCCSRKSSSVRISSCCRR